MSQSRYEELNSRIIPEGRDKEFYLDFLEKNPQFPTQEVIETFNHIVRERRRLREVCLEQETDLVRYSTNSTHPVLYLIGIHKRDFSAAHTSRLVESLEGDGSVIVDQTSMYGGSPLNRVIAIDSSNSGLLEAEEELFGEVLQYDSDTEEYNTAVVLAMNACMSRERFMVNRWKKRLESTMPPLVVLVQEWDVLCPYLESQLEGIHYARFVRGPKIV